MTPIIDNTYMRQFYRIENAVPNDIIDREIDFVRNRFVDYFGDVFTDAEADAQEETPENPILIDQLKTAMANLIMARLFSERAVITGFGVVVKEEEYANEIDDEKAQMLASHYATDGSTILHSIPELKKKDVSGCVVDCQNAINGFFAKKDDCTLYKYFPYNIYW